MSSEVAKKRGRPKKTISDPVETEVPESTKKTTTRAKSTKAVPKVVKAAPPTSTKSPVVEKPIFKPIATSPTPPKAAPKPPAPPTAPQKPAPVPAKTAVKTPVTPETSKILKKVRELSAKTVPPAADPAKYSEPSSTTTPLKPSFPPPQPKAAPSSTPASSNPIKPSAKPVPAQLKPVPSAKSTPPPSAKPMPKPYIPIAAMNSAIVSNISTRAGARPNVDMNSQEFAQRYKSVARKVTLAIVAMPIAIVTSWVLYERLVLGEDRKLLVKPGLAMVETPTAADAKADGTPSSS